MGLGGKVSPTQMQWRHCQIFAWLYHSCCFPHSIQQILRKKPVHVPLVLRVKCSLPEVACVLVAFHAGVSSGPPSPIQLHLPTVLPPHCSLYLECSSHPHRPPPATVLPSSRLWFTDDHCWLLSCIAPLESAVVSAASPALSTVPGMQNGSVQLL